MCASIQGLHYASQGQQAQDLNISLTVTTTETEQRRRKPQGRVEDRYYTIQEYKALSNEQNKSQSYSQTMGPMLELVRRQPNLALQHVQMSQPTLKTVITAMILPSLANEPDTG